MSGDTPPDRTTADTPNPDAFRALPSVHEVARAMDGAGAPGVAVVDHARRALAEARGSIRDGASAPPFEDIVERGWAMLDASRRGSLRPVINASGVILHTNLGRAPLSRRAVEAVREVSLHYSNLEFELEEGRRGSRYLHARDLIRQVTGAQDALVVNNNAAAVFFVLQALASGRGVVVSRGEAVEIGGGFRIPDVVGQSGALIREVGTTNRTYARDYEAAIDESTAAILRVHASNFRVVGFTARPTTEELVEVARAHGVLLIDDLGSGALIATEQFGMAHEPMVQESLSAGADLALFSGDKLVGGPQCGIIAGRADLLEQLRRHPLARALRVDKTTLAALNATMMAYAEGTAIQELAPWRMLALDAADVRARAERWVAAAGGGKVSGEVGGEVRGARTMIGGGSLPEEGVPTTAAAVAPVTSAGQLAASLREWPTPIVARVEDDRVLLDPRTVDPEDDATVCEALATLIGNAR